jgi:hypothetical protein
LDKSPLEADQFGELLVYWAIYPSLSDLVAFVFYQASPLTRASLACIIARRWRAMNTTPSIQNI